MAENIPPEPIVEDWDGSDQTTVRGSPILSPSINSPRMFGNEITNIASPSTIAATNHQQDIPTVVVAAPQRPRRTGRSQGAHPSRPRRAHQGALPIRNRSPHQQHGLDSQNLAHPSANMAHSNRNLPIPQYVLDEHARSTESTDSQESVMTQVPLAYYEPDGVISYEGQPTSSASRSRGTQGMSSQHVGAYGSSMSMNTNAGTSSRQLDPNSSPYVPGSQQALGVQLSSNPQGYGNGYGVNMNGSTAMSIVPYREQQAGYASANQAGMMSMGMGAPPVGGYVNGPPNPYAHFGAGMGNGENMGYGPGNSNAQVGMNMIPPSNNMSYGAGMGMNMSSNYGAGAILGPNNDYAVRYGGGYNNGGYAVQGGGGMYHNPANVNRGPQPVAAYIPKVHPYSVYKNGGASSNLATAPIQQAVAGSSGSVQAPSTSSDVNSRSSTRESSHGRSSASVHDSDAHSSVGPTPTPKNQRSSNHNTETPTLRNRRNQSIDGSRNGVMAQWLAELPAGANKHTATPPKMLNLLTGGGIDGNKVLASINKADPFSPSSNMETPRPVAHYNNPFVSPPALAAPAFNLPPFWIPGVTPRSQLLTQLIGSTDVRRPTYEEAIDKRFFPFMEIGRAAKSDEQHGVIRIRNIPYSVQRSEILAFLGRNARIISESQFEPVHIIMERVTSKTLDCFVEYISFNEAVQAVTRFENNRMGGRAGRLGQRHVELELSSQDQLLKELFPKAKNVKWENGKPTVIPRDPNDANNSGFQGFISKEELVMLVKHVEAPQRSPFSKDCPQRPFECLISTLRKYPWYMVDYITLDDLIQLHQTTIRLLELLKDRISNNYEDIHLTPMLYKRAWLAALTCPGFTPVMKDDIKIVCDIDDKIAIAHSLPQFASFWHPFWTIAQKPNMPQDVVLYYAELLREETEHKQELSLAERAAQGDDDGWPKLFGDIRKHFEYPLGYRHSNLAQMASYEWAAIEKLLRQALTPKLTQ